MSDVYVQMILQAVAKLPAKAPREDRWSLYQDIRSSFQQTLSSGPLANVNRELIEIEKAIISVEEAIISRPGTFEPSRRLRELRERLQSPPPRSRKEKMDGRSEAALAAIQEALNVSDRAAKEPSRTLPSISAIPEQDFQRAIGFVSTSRGALDLALDIPRNPHDVEQSMLYTRIRSQLQQLKESIPSQERSQIDAALDDFLEQPESWDRVEFKKILWLCGNSIRTLLAQHDALKDSTEPHYSKLPPAVAEAMRRPVHAWNVFIQGDQDLAALDAVRVGPQEQSEILKHLLAAKEFIDVAAADRNISTERAANALKSTIKAAEIDNNNITTKLEQDLADKTQMNFFAQILRKAYSTLETILSPELVATEFTKGAAKAAGTAALLYAGTQLPIFFEFIATNSGSIKSYILITFQSAQMAEIVDAIRHEYLRLKGKIGG